MEYFKDRLRQLVIKFADGKHTRFAKNSGIPAGSFQHNYDNGVVPKAEHLIRISETYRVNLHWLLTGEGPMTRTEAGAGTAQGAAGEAANPKVVSVFQNPERAREITALLVQIERLNPGKLESVETYLRGLLEGLKTDKEKPAAGPAPTKSRKKRAG